jgi:acyl transferase domain-containing protein
LDVTADWAEFGFDSILLASFINKFNTQYGLNLMPTVLFEATNINHLSRYLAENFSGQMLKKLHLNGEEQPKSKPASQTTTDVPVDNDQKKISTFAQGFKKKYKASVAYRDSDMAIVGMSCRIAGARTPDEFWKMLDEGRDMITEIPKDRWDWRDYPGVSKWGSFIDVAEFDPLFFGISPAETLYMAPEQRLMMQYVWECLEDAGYSADELKGTDTGLFVGCGPSTYADVLSVLPVEAYSATGMVPSVGPNRVSYIMDWHGPSNPIDTACSSALVALHRAVEAIRAGHCSQAIVGAANALVSPSVYISFSKSGMLCDDGKCKTFSDKANGYVRGEGVGMLMIKPLKAAIEDGNTIYAVVKGTAENHNGHTNSLTAPSPRSQAAVIKKAVKDSGIDFSRVGYIECHGTGTSLGDPIEIEGLKMAASDLLKESDKSSSIYLGSIKSNIGHLEYAAGVVGLIKAILQMKHKKIAKSLYCENINPYINLTGTPFVIAQKACDWNVEPGQTRVAGVSSFGFGGVNAHVVLEEFQPVGTQQFELQDETDRTHIITISAKTEESLINYVAQFRNYIKTVDKSATVLTRIAYTLQVGRSEMHERVAFVIDSFEDWEDQMDAFIQSSGKISNKKIHRGKAKTRSSATMEIADNFSLQPSEANEYERIAELWVKGSKIDWQVLYKS